MHWMKLITCPVYRILGSWREGLNGDGRDRRIRPPIPECEGVQKRNITLRGNQGELRGGDNPEAGWTLKQEADLDSQRWGKGCRSQIRLPHLTSLHIGPWGCRQGLWCLNRQRQWPAQAWLCPNWGDQLAQCTEDEFPNLKWPWQPPLRVTVSTEIREWSSLQHRPGPQQVKDLLQVEEEERLILRIGW